MYSSSPVTVARCRARRSRYSRNARVFVALLVVCIAAVIPAPSRAYQEPSTWSSHVVDVVPPSTPGRPEAEPRVAARPGISVEAPAETTVTVFGAVTADAVSVSVADSLLRKRSHHTATVLANGAVLYAGGIDDSKGIASAEIYDPSTASFTPTEQLIEGRGFHTATPLHDGFVLLAGGTDTFRTLRSAELYDPEAGVFVPADALTHARWLHGAAALSDGNILVTGGIGSGGALETAELFDAESRTFQLVGRLRDARYGHTTTVLENGEVLIAGGTDDSRILASAEIYNPLTKQFRSTGNMQHARYHHSATRLPNGNVLMAGGTGASGFAEVYDVASGAFMRVGDLEQPRAGHGALLTPHGKVYIVGGSDPHGFLTSAELYEPSTGTFSTTTSLREPRFGQSATLLPDGTALVAGSEDRSSTASSSAELVAFRPTNTFSGTLAIPTGWIMATSILTFTGSTSQATLDAATLDTGRWQLAQPNEPLTATIGFGSDGFDHRLILRMRDQKGQTADVAAATVRVDATPPRTEMTPLPPISGRSIRLQWRGSDATSGIASYDVEVRDGLDGPWDTLVYGTTERSTTFTGHPEHMYFFRVRATDVAGNTEAWPPHADAQTLAAPATAEATWSGERHVPRYVDWERVASLPRLGHTASRLHDGSVLIAGGSTTTVVAQRYEPATGLLKAVGNMRRARVGHTATTLGDGSVLLVGGNTGTAERYDPATNSFMDAGTMLQRRTNHTATLLRNGLVLIVGGTNGAFATASAELYDPATNQWTPTGSLLQPREYHTATRLADGRVLVIGGTDDGRALATTEIYDPSVGVFANATRLRRARFTHTATALANGSVLVVGGSNEDRTLPSTELFDPVTATFSVVGTLFQRRYEHTATLLADDSVLIVGGNVDNQALDSVEVFDLPASKFSFGGELEQARSGHTVTRLADANILVVGGDGERSSQPEVERGELLPANTFRGTLTVPTDWISQTTTVALSGTTTGAGIDAANVGGDFWIPIQANRRVSTPLPVPRDGVGQPLVLRLRDTRGLTAEVVTATMNIDTASPRTTVVPLSPTSSPMITLRWSASDATSGVLHYDVEVRRDRVWTPLLGATTAVSTTFVGEADQDYAFRVRAHDVAGNVEPWHNSHIVETRIDATTPVGALIINGGAVATTDVQIHASLAITDSQSALRRMRFNLDDIWLPWRSYAPTTTLTLTGTDGFKTIKTQVEDAAGNVSPPITQTIRLDQATGVADKVRINAGAEWTNSPTVTLRIGAGPTTSEMQISDNDAFKNTRWQPFDTAARALLVESGPYTEPRRVFVRTRDVNKTVSVVSSDEIIYDPVPPSGRVVIEEVGVRSVAVRLRANDPNNLSGIRRMRVSLDPQFRGARWQPYTTNTLALPRPSRDPLVYVFAQFEDGAGNQSAKVCGASNGKACVAPNAMVFLPLVRR